MPTTRVHDPPVAEGASARVPSWLSDYGHTHCPVTGLPNYIWITDNMAGCADDGCIWEKAYDTHLKMYRE